MHQETSFSVVFLSALVKNVDSLMSANGRTSHLFSLLLVIHYFEDKKRHTVSFKRLFSGTLSRARAKKLLSNFSSVQLFLSVWLVKRPGASIWRSKRT